MTNEELEAFVYGLVREVSGADPSRINSEQHLAEFGVDSLRAMELVVRLEEQFGIVFPGEVLIRLKSVGDLVGYLGPRVVDERPKTT